MSHRLFLLGAIALSIAPSLPAQVQIIYGGSNAAGRLVRTAVTNASQSALPFARLFGKATKVSAPEVKLHEVLPQRSALKLRFGLSALATSSAQSLSISRTTAASSFLGLTHYDQRNANNGNQFSVEPPSQDLAVANGYILEGVNNAIQVYSTAGPPLLPATLATNELFGVAAAIDRDTGINGVFPTDMRVFYDRDIDRWFVLQRAQDYDVDGFPLNSSHLYVAVSQTGDPTAFYNVYTMDTTNALRPGCPCFSDFPQIGADSNGIYISSDEYDTFFGQFVDVSMLAISKVDLGSGQTAPRMQEFVIGRSTGYEGTIRPAITPPGASYFVAAGGAEFFLSTNTQFYTDSNFALWMLVNTASLNGTPALTLIQTVIPGLSSYTYPDDATQKPGFLEYGSTLSPPGLLALVHGGRDSRVLSLAYAGARLYATYATQARDANGMSVVAGGYAIIAPTLRGGKLQGFVTRQCDLVVDGNHVLRPAVAVKPQGGGGIVFTLAGPDYFPSAAFVPIDKLGNVNTAQVAALGVLPEDGFTGYPDIGFPLIGVARWGDYSSAVTASDGSIWMVTEYIPDAPRTEFANWGTRVIRYAP